MTRSSSTLHGYRTDSYSPILKQRFNGQSNQVVNFDVVLKPEVAEVAEAVAPVDAGVAEVVVDAAIEEPMS